MDGLPLKGLEDASRLESFFCSSRITYSHQQRLRKLLAPRDDVEIGPAVHRVERRHSVNRVFADRPAASVAADHREHIHFILMTLPSPPRIDSREYGKPSGDQYKRRAGRAVRLRVDSLHRGRSLVYAQRISFDLCVRCILHHTKYPQYNIHKKQHSVSAPLGAYL